MDEYLVGQVWGRQQATGVFVRPALRRGLPLGGGLVCPLGYVALVVPGSDDFATFLAQVLAAARVSELEGRVRNLVMHDDGTIRVERVVDRLNRNTHLMVFRFILGTNDDRRQFLEDGRDNHTRGLHVADVNSDASAGTVGEDSGAEDDDR